VYYQQALESVLLLLGGIILVEFVKNQLRWVGGKQVLAPCRLRGMRLDHYKGICVMSSFT
jgi:hypothetical protein